MKEFILTGIFVGVAAVLGLVSRFVFKKKPDNYIEEFAEKVIYKKTGIDIDLSPDHPHTNTRNIVDVTKTLHKEKIEEKVKERVD